MDRSTRGQSETVGTLLVLAVVVLTVTTSGYYVLTSLYAGGQAGESVTADVSLSITADALTLTHRGGDGIDDGALRVVVRYAGTDAEYAVADGTYQRGDAGRFEPGERWTLTAPWSEGDAVEVVVVHAPSQRVLVRGSRASVT